MQAPTLEELKARIRSAQVRAALAVNRELVLLYWSIGQDVLRRQEAEGWGSKVVDRLARDLQTEFPGIEGFSPRSLKYMRALAEAWPEEAFVQQLIAQLPWGHNLRILDRVKDRPTREWYLRAALEHGWSQNVLVHRIAGRLHEREGKSLSNFGRPCLRETRTWRPGFCATRTTSTSSPSVRTSTNASSNAVCSST